MNNQSRFKQQQTHKHAVKISRLWIFLQNERQSQNKVKSSCITMYNIATKNPTKAQEQAYVVKISRLWISLQIE
jgi:hypothetical protein